MTTFTNEEVLEDGITKISIYDASSHKLLSYYHVNSEGEKHGREVEYCNGRIVAEREYKNGKKHGIELEHDGIIPSKRKYKNGECIIYDCSPSEIKDFLEENVLCGKYILSNCNKITITKENGQYKHISTGCYYHGGSDTYRMTFKNNKEFNGYSRGLYSHSPEPCYTYKNGILDGKIKTDSHEGTYTNGVFTGRKYISSIKSLAKKIFIDEGFKLYEYDQTTCYQEIKNDKVISEHCKISVPDGNGHFYRYHIDFPYNGMATIIRKTYWNDIYKQWTCEMKNGKKNGACTDYRKKTNSVYVDDVLDGPHLKFYDEHLEQIKAQYSYKQGKIDGVYTEFFKNQHKKIEGFYKDGQKNGVWRYYSEDDKLISTEFWQYGKNKTKKFKLMKKIASERIKQEDELSKDKEKRVILPKMSKLEKAVAMYKAKRQNG